LSPEVRCSGESFPQKLTARNSSWN